MYLKLGRINQIIKNNTMKKAFLTVLLGILVAWSASCQEKSLIYAFGAYMSPSFDADGRLPLPLEIGANMGNTWVLFQSEVRRGNTYATLISNNVPDISIDTRYSVISRLKRSINRDIEGSLGGYNHFLGGYFQFTTTSMVVDGATIGLFYRYTNQPPKKIGFFADFLFPVLGYNKILKWNTVEQHVNSIVFGHNLNRQYRARNTEIRFKV